MVHSSSFVKERSSTSQLHVLIVNVCVIQSKEIKSISSHCRHGNLAHVLSNLNSVNG